MITSEKIPHSFTMLPEFYSWLNHAKRYQFETELIITLSNMSGKPNNSNASFKQIAAELAPVLSEAHFMFYWSKNPISGHNVISYASGRNVVYYNTRFHSVSKFEFRDWLGNYYHERTHNADEVSPYSFTHKNQSDKKAAPFEVERVALSIFDANPERWL